MENSEKKCEKTKIGLEGKYIYFMEKIPKKSSCFLQQKKKENKNKNCLQVRVIYFALRGQRQTTTLTTATTTTIRTIATATTTLKYHY